jgi:hypothetical protein
MAQEQRDQQAQPSAAPPPLAGLMGLLQRWNFIERARLQRELWDECERGEPIEQLVEACPAADAFRREVWQTTAQRIRRIEALMAGKNPTGPP